MTLREYLEDNDLVLLMYNGDKDIWPEKIRLYSKEIVYAYYPYMLDLNLTEFHQEIRFFEAK